MEQRKLGQLEVCALGLRCMGMSEFFGPRNTQESVATIQPAVDEGMDFIDTTDMVGPFIHEEAARRTLAEMGLRPKGSLTPLGEIRQIFTHRDATALVFRARTSGKMRRADSRWACDDELASLALSAFGRKMIALCKGANRYGALSLPEKTPIGLLLSGYSLV